MLSKTENRAGHQADWLEIFDQNACLARAYVPFQRIHKLFTPEAALRKGTIFPELAIPYHAPPHSHARHVLAFKEEVSP